MDSLNDGETQFLIRESLGSSIILDLWIYTLNKCSKNVKI